MNNSCGVFRQCGPGCYACIQHIHRKALRLASGTKMHTRNMEEYLLSHCQTLSPIKRRLVQVQSSGCCPIRSNSLMGARLLRPFRHRPSHTLIHVQIHDSLGLVSSALDLKGIGLKKPRVCLQARAHMGSLSLCYLVPNNDAPTTQNTKKSGRPWEEIFTDDRLHTQHKREIYLHQQTKQNHNSRTNSWSVEGCPNAPPALVEPPKDEREASRWRRFQKRKPGKQDRTIG